MDFDLVVISPVAGYEAGQRISDPNKVAAIMADREQAAHVVKVAPAKAADASVEPAPDTKTDKAAKAS
ncbi:hypothetical protein [Methylobacterium haplocladii]|uniref:Uncharacterized protein n=1 Tax=Methylobacterium haplocladii TaxID=1176176 RepID=A0A512ISG6_9HYPH|nr:hypothetical protein [Methylobacterium haplocladii]GEP00648.1 hypothetical protein MHA02_30350 [Methylobacterium haplocladii]GJD85411.1 hypothetical protein HPGCJGGD_3300 [Methylobacterium haplocladii]GLS57796.1 hypothetical protein GCM10007887_04520 [Methylobacterium haplocladii]